MQVPRPRPQNVTRLEQVTQLTEEEKKQLQPVAEQFAFRTNEYYQSLINWDDPNDPIRRIVMPDIQELQEFGQMDASDESSYTVLRGLEHKYADTALLLVNDVCGAYCRFCFRKRLFIDGNNEVTRDITDALEYIKLHPEISNVLLSGGDPMIMSTGKLEGIIQRLREIDHVRIIRIGTKMPVFDPYRILNDPSLLEMITRYSRVDRRIFVMVHFNHPRELTAPALEGLQLLQKAGAITMNQSPILRGVNDKSEIITELFGKLAYNGVVPYYLFICRPTSGNESFILEIERALEIFEDARRSLHGLAKQARLCMSHKTGKIEVVGKTETKIIFRYHRTPNPLDCGRVMVFDTNTKATWFDDYARPEPMLNLSLGEKAQATSGAC